MSLGKGRIGHGFGHPFRCSRVVGYRSLHSEGGVGGETGGTVITISLQRASQEVVCIVCVFLGQFRVNSFPHGMALT